MIGKVTGVVVAFPAADLEGLPKVGLFRRRDRFAQHHDVGVRSGAENPECLAVGRPVEDPRNIRRKVRDTALRRAVQGVDPDIVAAVLLTGLLNGIGYGFAVWSELRWVPDTLIDIHELRSLAASSRQPDNHRFQLHILARQGIYFGKVH